VRWLLLLLCCGCHFGWSTWSGVKPRTNRAARVALFARDDASKVLSHKALARDPSLTVVDIDASMIDPSQRESCSNDTCAPRSDAACAWAKSQSIDFYVVGTTFDSFDQNYKCTKYEHKFWPTLNLGDGDKDDDGPRCIEGHYENERTTATFTLDVYDVATCSRQPLLSTKATLVASGVEEVSKPEARARIEQEGPLAFKPFPDQVEVSAAGTVDAADGYYAMYRQNDYRGFVEVKSGKLRSLHCCDVPGVGDQLVARGERKLVELALDGVLGSMTFDGKRRAAGGPGIHLRYYPLDAGVRYGFGVDLLGNGNVDASAAVFTPEVGWGFRPSSAFSLSANLGAGWTRGFQRTGGMDLGSASALTVHVMPTLRAISFFAKWWYVGADVGFLYSGMLDTWDGDGAGDARPISLRTPLVRAWLGVDL
jgi:hypothetical protein